MRWKTMATTLILTLTWSGSSAAQDASAERRTCSTEERCITKEAKNQCKADAEAADECQQNTERQARFITELEESNEELFNKAFDLSVNAELAKRRATWRGVGWGLAGGCAVGLSADLFTAPTLRSSAALGGCVLTGLLVAWMAKPKTEGD